MDSKYTGFPCRNLILPIKLKMKIAILAAISWRTPLQKYGPWGQIASYLAEG